MSSLNAVLSFLATTPATNTPAIQEKNMKNTVPAAPVKKNPEDSILLLAAKSQRQARQIAKLQANAEFDDACIAQQDAEIAKLREQVKQLEALQTLLVRNASFQASQLCTLVNDNAKQANKLVNELEVAIEASVIANSWGNEALIECNRQAKLADAFRNIARSSRARVSSNFALPIVEGEIEAAELAYFDRIEIDKAEDLAESVTPVSRKLVCFGKADLEGNFHCRSCRRVEARRGHRHGHTDMSARATFHYLNR